MIAQTYIKTSVGVSFPYISKDDVAVNPASPQRSAITTLVVNKRFPTTLSVRRVVQPRSMNRFLTRFPDWT